MMKELEDYNWFPSTLRSCQMEFIGSLTVWTRLYLHSITILQKIINANKIVALHDTCSGSGSAAVHVHGLLNARLPMLLTDKYPNNSFQNKPTVSYSSHAVDVLEMPFAENTIYTMYNAFHHFTDEEQKGLIKKMVINKIPFLIAEILEPGLFTLMKVIFTTTILQLLMAPFVKPFSLVRLFFTYIIPVNLFTITYDGIVSVYKSKTTDQYKELLKNSSTLSYSITVNRMDSWKGNVVYIKGESIIR